jgi:predicted enzyme related to lactoylglutathione lyase
VAAGVDAIPADSEAGARERTGEYEEFRMASILRNVTFDCTDPARVADFWSAVLDRPVDPGGNEWIRAIGQHDRTVGPAWLFLRVPEPKAAKNRVHVDLSTADREQEVARLVALGATRVADKNEWGAQWTVMADPEGNEFCVTANRQ